VRPESTREFSGVWCQHRRIAQLTEQRVRLAGKGGERIGIEDDGRVARHNGRNHFLGRAPNAASRSDDDGIEARVLQKVRETCDA